MKRRSRRPKEQSRMKNTEPFVALCTQDTGRGNIMGIIAVNGGGVAIVEL